MEALQPPRKQTLAERLVEAEADLAAAKKAQQTYDRQADEYRALSAEPNPTQIQSNYINASIQCRAQAAGMEREVFDCDARVRALRAMLADQGEGAELVLPAEQVAAMDETAGVLG
ncbi:MAG TPA: hypothetical protein VGF12_07210 [Roseateles sp.]|uniref:hypothetical protein n=1 Tax=Roseateles sp. TaxID=1971397 RepID=UPI002EDAA7A3